MPISQNEKETQKLAAKIGQKIEKGGVICLFGDLGTGKTTFVKGLAEHFGINEFTIKSPTYTYMRKHVTAKNKLFCHIDLYRLEQIDELILEEIYELFENKDSIIVIEWAEKMEEYLPPERIDIYFKYIDEKKRELQIK